MSLLLGNDQAIQQIVKIQSDLVVLLKDTGQIDAGIAGEQICQRRNGGVGGGDEIRIAGAAGGIAACVLVDQRKLAFRGDAQRAEAFRIDDSPVCCTVCTVAIGVELKFRGNLRAQIFC